MRIHPKALEDAWLAAFTTVIDLLNVHSCAARAVTTLYAVFKEDKSYLLIFGLNPKFWPVSQSLDTDAKDSEAPDAQVLKATPGCVICKCNGLAEKHFMPSQAPCRQAERMHHPI